MARTVVITKQGIPGSAATGYSPGGTDVSVSDGGTGASSAAAARTNLGVPATTDLTSHTGNTSNPHSVTKAQVGLSNVDNTSDVNKPVSTAQAAALGGMLSVVDNGQETIPRMFAVNNITQNSQTFRLTYFTARKSEAAANVVVTTTGTPAGATPTLIRFGLYSVAGNGDLTLVASTPNDTTLLAVANTEYSKALSAPFALTAGNRYAFGALVVTAATAPTVAGFAQAGSAAMTARAPRMGGFMAAQTDLPASVASGSVSSATGMTLALFTP